jgi:hypothetical protein
MEKKLILILVFFTFLLSKNSFSNITVIVNLSDFKKKVVFENKRTGEIKNIAELKEFGKVFILECKDLSDITLTAKELVKIQFLRLDTREITPWIFLKEEESTSIRVCFEKNQIELYQAENYPDDVLLDFILSNYQTKTVNVDFLNTRSLSKDFLFSPNNLDKFRKVEDINIKWSTNLKIRKALIKDAFTNSIIWEEAKLKENEISYKKLRSGLLKTFEYNQPYTLIVDLFSAVNNLQDFKFSLVYLTFKGKNPAFFITPDSVKFSWLTDYVVKEVTICESQNYYKPIWKKNGVLSGQITAKDLKGIKKNLDAKKSYKLKVTVTKDGNDFIYDTDFEIILSRKEFRELKNSQP